MLKTFGTGSFSGLNTQGDASLIGDGQLTVAQNVNTESGAAVPVNTDTGVAVTVSDDAYLGIMTYERSGAEHVIFKIDDTIYEDNLSKPIFAAGNQYSTTFMSINGRAYFVDGVAGNNKVWDGTYLRDIGPLAEVAPATLTRAAQSLLGVDVIPPTAAEDFIVNISNHATAPTLSLSGGVDKTITGISKAASAVVSSTAHGLNAGDVVLIHSVNGMGQINYRQATISSVNANDFTIPIATDIQVDSIDVFDDYSSGGKARLIAFDISGITKANPGVVTTTSAHGLSNGDIVYLEDTTGMPEVDGTYQTVANVGPNTFEIEACLGHTAAATAGLAAPVKAHGLNSSSYITINYDRWLLPTSSFELGWLCKSYLEQMAEDAGAVIPSNTAHFYFDQFPDRAPTPKRYGVLAAATNYTFTLETASGTDIASTGWGDHTIGTGVVRLDGIGFSGTYKYASSVQVTMPDGLVLESNLTPIHQSSLWGGSKSNDKITFSEDDRVVVNVPHISTGSVSGYVTPTTGLGTTLLFQVRIYRTKDLSLTGVGEDYYLLSEETHANSYNQGDTVVSCDDTTPDSGLGALFVHGMYDHGIPPTADLCRMVGSRAFYVVDNRVYFSMRGEPDYVHELSSHKLGDTITALGRFGDQVAAFGDSRMWLIDQYDEIGSVREVDVPAGCIYPYGPVATPYGLVWPAATGLWLYDGSYPKSLTDEEIKNDWVATTALVNAAPAGAYWRGNLWYAMNQSPYSGASAWSYVGCFDPSGVVRWSRESISPAVAGAGQVSHFAVGTDAQTLYCGATAVSGNSLRKVRASSSLATKTIQTKKWGDGSLYRGEFLILDINTGSTNETVTVMTNRDTTGQSYTINTAYRQTVRKSLPLTLLGEQWYVKSSGTGTVYGIALELA